VNALRKLVLGETWSLPLGVAVVLVVGLVLDAIFGTHSWWRSAGGFVLLAGVLLALSASLPRRR
jgi:type IV secretory pathway VirB2 component (pilin)